MTNEENRRIREQLSYEDFLHEMLVIPIDANKVIDNFDWVKDQEFDRLRLRFQEAYTRLSQYIYDHPAAIEDRENE